jgi:HD-GYP domain-containing protein (c-di-GMP phosphodiesterase class II)
VVVIGLLLLASALWGALALTFTDLGWWFGHLCEFVGITLVGASVAYDLYRAGQSRPLAGDLSASEMVAAEEAFLGARVRALMVRLAEKDSSTEEHTRRVAALAVAIGGLLHDIGKLSIPNSILQKPGPLDDAEFAVIKRHPAHGYELLTELGGFNDTVVHLVLDHHERLDGSGYPRGIEANELSPETRILAVCDVYDALVSPRVYRAAWTPERALELLRSETDTAFDADCVEALVHILSPELPAAEPPVQALPKATGRRLTHALR